MVSPGVCVTRGTHGLQRKPSIPSADADLRGLLRLSCDVPIVQVMQTAATAIRSLRSGEAQEEIQMTSVPGPAAPRGRGRPPGSRNRRK